MTDVIVIDCKDNTQNIIALIASMKLSGKTIMIHNPTLSIVIELAAMKQSKMIYDLKEEAKLISEIKNQDLEYYLDNEPNPILPFSESRRRTNIPTKHVIWDYG